MEIESTLQFGTVEVKISAKEASEHDKAVDKALSFLEENSERLKDIQADLGQQKLSHSQAKDSVQDKSHTSRGASGDNVETNSEEKEDGKKKNTDKLADISEELRVDENILRDVFIIQEDSKPILYLEDNEVLGEYKSERQRRGALMILYLWDACYGEDRMKSTELKNTLNLSDIDSSKMSNMYQGDGKNLFDRGGRGPSATVGLTPRGKRQSIKEIRKLVTEIQSSDSEPEEDTAEQDGQLTDFN